MKKLLLSSVAAATMLTTASVAKIATDGTGELLIAPAFYADQGFSTKLKVLNTSLNKSYIYRVAVREYVSSQEFDFIITLSPSDVWSGEIKPCGDGTGVCLVSTDDSNLGGAINVNITKRYNSNLSLGKKARSFKKGYVEFLPIAMYQEELDGTTSDPIKKKTLAERFKKIQGGASGGAAMNTVGGPYLVSGEGVAGFATLVNKDWKSSMTIPMTAFEDVVTLPTSPSGATVSFSVDASAENYIGKPGVDIIAADLKTQATFLPYENGGLNDGVYFTFWGDQSGREFTENAVFDFAKKKGCLQARSFSVHARDMEENPGEDTVARFSPDVNPENSVRCEMNSVIVSDLLSAANADNFKSGMVLLDNLTNVRNGRVKGTSDFVQKAGDNPAAIITYMNAVDVDGQTSYSWTYAPTLRK